MNEKKVMIHISKPSVDEDMETVNKKLKIVKVNKENTNRLRDYTVIDEFIINREAKSEP